MTKGPLHYLYIANWGYGDRVRTVFTNGCFDLIHAGHVDLLYWARGRGKRLIVGLNSDSSVERIKGKGRPLSSFRYRAEVLSALRCVDEVIGFEEDTPERLIEKLRPDLIVKGADWHGRYVAGSRVAPVEFVQFQAGISTTSLIRKVIELYKAGIIDEDGRSRE